MTGFVKTVSIMRLRRRFMLEVGASPSLILFCARGSAGLGRGEIRSTSAMGGGSKTALDLKVEKEQRPEQGVIFFNPNDKRLKLLNLSSLLSYPQS